MKRIIIPFCASLLLTACSHEGVKMSFDGFTNDTVVVMHAAIEDVMKLQSDSDPLITYDTLIMKNGVVEFARDITRAQQYICVTKEVPGEGIILFVAPGESIDVKVENSEGGQHYTVKGSDLMEGISEINEKARIYIDEINAMPRVAEMEQKIDSLYQRYSDVYSDYLKNHLDHPAAVWALQNVPNDTVLAYIDQLGKKATESIMSPLLEGVRKSVERYRTIQKARESIVEGAMAPDFNLPDVQGNMVSLQSLRGKWVVIDFWGTWCPWCIKGFPEMKEYYAKYNTQCAFVGICCRDSKEEWLAGVKDYELPWINLYSDPDTDPKQAVETIYAIQGYPTKMIISPEGKIAKIVIGEDPAFYEALKELVK